MSPEEQRDERQANSSILAAKILQAIEDPHIVNWFSTDMTLQNDGYAMIKSLTQYHIPQLSPQMSYNTTTDKPTYTTETDILSFHSRYCLWLQVEKRANRLCGEKDHFAYFIQQLGNDQRYTEAIHEAERACPIAQTDVPQRYKLPLIAHTLLKYQTSQASGDLDAIQPNNMDMRISAAEANKRGGERPKWQNGGDKQKWQNGGERPRWQNRQRNQQRRPTQREEIQCNRCQLYGHRGAKCNIFNRVYWCLQYMKQKQHETSASAKDFRENNTPTAKAAQTASIKRAFATLTDLPEDVDTYSDYDLEKYETFAESFTDLGHISKLYDESTDTTERTVKTPDTDTTSITDIITQLTTSQGTQQRPHEPMDHSTIAQSQAPLQLQIPPIPDFMTYDTSLHSCDMDICRPCHDDITVNMDNTQPEHQSDAYIRVLLKTHESQSDTGANRHLTNTKQVLKDFKICTPFTIGTIEEDATVTVTGTGITSIQTSNPTKPLVYETLYSPKASGSVFSPEKYATDNKDHIRMWSQMGDTQSRQGAIVFYNKERHPSTIIPLYPRNGLWYMKISTPE